MEVLQALTLASGLRLEHSGCYSSPDFPDYDNPLWQYVSAYSFVRCAHACAGFGFDRFFATVYESGRPGASCNCLVRQPDEKDRAPEAACSRLCQFPDVRASCGEDYDTISVYEITRAANASSPKSVRLSELHYHMRELDEQQRELLHAQERLDRIQGEIDGITSKIDDIEGTMTETLADLAVCSSTKDLLPTDAARQLNIVRDQAEEINRLVTELDEWYIKKGVVEEEMRSISPSVDKKQREIFDLLADIEGCKEGENN